MEQFFVTPSAAILLIIDIQDRLVPAMSHADQVIAKTNTLIKIARRLAMPIVVTEQYPKGLGRTVSAIRENLTEANIAGKTTFSACTPEILASLSQLNRRKVIITGMETHVCVFQTARDLLKQGYEVFAVGDALCSRTKHNYRNGLALMQSMGAVITNTETVFFDLMKQAGTPEFKELSPLIK